jgi:hypothetical protein
MEFIFTNRSELVIEIPQRAAGFASYVFPQVGHT